MRSTWLAGLLVASETVALACAVPPLPVQDSVNVEAAVNALVEAVPLVN